MTDVDKAVRLMLREAEIPMERPDMIYGVLDRLGLVDLTPDATDQLWMEVDRLLDLYYSNGSPCWICGGGSGEMALVYDEEEEYYRHEECHENA